MKITLIILTFMCNACYGQDTSFYNTGKLSYTYLLSSKVLDSILKVMNDSGWIPYSLGDATTIPIDSTDKFIYLDDPPVYHRKRDTVMIMATCMDTAHIYSVPSSVDSVSLENSEIKYWVKGKTIQPYDEGMKTKLELFGMVLYDVREKHNYNENGIVNGVMQYQWRVMGENKNDYWKHLYYLDSNKERLSKSIIVWQAIEVK